jgi:hypothetical protein
MFAHPIPLELGNPVPPAPPPGGFYVGSSTRRLAYIYTSRTRCSRRETLIAPRVRGGRMQRNTRAHRLIQGSFIGLQFSRFAYPSTRPGLVKICRIAELTFPDCSFPLSQSYCFPRTSCHYFLTNCANTNDCDPPPPDEPLARNSIHVSDHVDGSMAGLVRI